MGVIRVSSFSSFFFFFILTSALGMQNLVSPRSASLSVMSDSLRPHGPLQTTLSMKFLRQQYRSGLPFPSPGDLPDPGIEPGSPALQADCYRLSHHGSCINPISPVMEAGVLNSGPSGKSLDSLYQITLLMVGKIS